MENNQDTLVTLAIHTFEQAQILKTRLESEGIQTFIHNVNQIQPSVSAGVRVRIKESDLPKALAIIEHLDLSESGYIKGGVVGDTVVRTILVPVDFSDYSLKACNTAFFMAEKLKADVVIMTAYFSPLYNNFPVFDPITSPKDAENYHAQQDEVKRDMENLKNLIQRKIEQGKLPDVNFKTLIEEGIPEEVIGNVSNQLKPVIVVMGTRGKNHKEQDLIGSVTAETIDHSTAPILAISEDDKLVKFADVKNIAYATNFGPNDLIAFDKMVTLLKPYTYKVFLIHIERNADVWNEVKLAGIREYFSQHYPQIETEYCLIKDNDFLKGLDSFVSEKQIDVISLNSYKRNIFARLFNPSIARKMIFHASTPMLIMHS